MASDDQNRACSGCGGGLDSGHCRHIEGTGVGGANTADEKNLFMGVGDMGNLRGFQAVGGG